MSVKLFGPHNYIRLLTDLCSEGHIPPAALSPSSQTFSRWL